MPSGIAAQVRYALALAIGCLVLVSCAASTPTGLPTTADIAGVCKTITTAEEMITPSDVSPAVACTGPHVYETYAVTTVPAAISGLVERPEPELLQASAANVCPLAPIRPYLGAGPMDSQWGVTVWTKFPTRSEWSAHVRAVVCDLVVDAPRPDDVPLVSFPLNDVMAYTDSGRVRLCRTGSPFVNVTCNVPHAGEKTGAVTIATGLSPPATRAAAQHACDILARAYTEQPNTPGFRSDFVLGPGGSTECWLSSTSTPVTGTERGGLVPR